MTAYDLMDKFNDILAEGGVWVLILLTFVEISPIKINPWSKIVEWFGNNFNKSVKEDIDKINKKVDKLDTRMDEMDSKIDENATVEARNRILRFGDEVSHGMNHSRDHFQQILIDIETYDAYCESHKNFKNHITKITSDRIIADYKQHDINNDFL